MAALLTHHGVAALVQVDDFGQPTLQYPNRYSRRVRQCSAAPAWNHRRSTDLLSPESVRRPPVNRPAIDDLRSKL